MDAFAFAEEGQREFVTDLVVELQVHVEMLELIRSGLPFMPMILSPFCRPARLLVRLASAWAVAVNFPSVARGCW